MTEPSILVYHTHLAGPYERALQGLGVHNVSTASTVVEAQDILSECEVIFGWKIPAELIRQAKNVRWIQSMGAGVDDLMQQPGLAPHLQLTRITGQFGDPIAEYVFARLLYIFKDLERSVQAQQNRAWVPFLEGTLAGKSIGIAGLGSIGCRVASLAKAFRMQVLGLSRTQALVRCPGLDQHFSPAEWLGFAEQSDILVLTLPLTPDTYHVVNEHVLARLKPGAWIVNVGRGSLIDEDSLIRALDQNLIGGAILDVFEQEPLPGNHPFWSMRNVLITPHVSGPSQIESVTGFFVENLKRYKSRLPLVGLVDRQQGY